MAYLTLCGIVLRCCLYYLYVAECICWSIYLILFIEMHGDNSVKDLGNIQNFIMDAKKAYNSLTALSFRKYVRGSRFLLH